jgi:hypothetical protein
MTTMTMTSDSVESNLMYLDQLGNADGYDDGDEPDEEDDDVLSENQALIEEDNEDEQD